ncbi:MAG: type II toxin-antitoxin system RelE/ParE family toxin [Saprospiraceae bacterium]
MKNLTISYTDIAREDLFEIFIHSVLEYGNSGADKYLATIYKGVSKLYKNPLMGHKREDLPVNYLALMVGQHFIIYR